MRRRSVNDDPAGFPAGAAAFVVACVGCAVSLASAAGEFRAADPGLRAAPGAGGPVTGLTAAETAFFTAGQVEFAEAEGASDGLGPRMNLDNCGGCHAQPRFGGSSPSTNPQVAFGKRSRTGALPSFVAADGPVRVVRFVKGANGSIDGSVQPLFTVAGRGDAPGCELAQPDFDAAIKSGNLVFRIPTPLYGAGLIEQIPDEAILANRASQAARNRTLGIHGRPQLIELQGNAGGDHRAGRAGAAIARFGWKAHNYSLLVAAAEAYHVEMGISNEIFAMEGASASACRPVAAAADSRDGDLPPIDTVQRYRNPLAHRYLVEAGELDARLAAFAARNPPGSRTIPDMNAQWTPDTASSVEKLAAFVRLLAPPAPSPDTPGGRPSIARGRSVFDRVQCGACHTPTLDTGDAPIVALRNKPVNLYSDLLLHDMGPALADGVRQGEAGGSDFRTAPLWGVGQRLFLLHDGRTTDMLEAIGAHRSGSATAGNVSEASAVIDDFDRLAEHDKQDLLNFLRSL